jgi:DNA-binding beta-propeller fold protein YncE
MSASITHAETYTFITQWGSQGFGNGQFNSPNDIAIDSLGNVYVADSGLGNDRIQKFSSNGNYLTQWGSRGRGYGLFNSPTGIAIDYADNVYVADIANNLIQKFDNSGTFLTQWGSYGSGEGQFKSPVGVAVDSSGNVYVTDEANHRIQKFDSSGRFLTKWGSYGSDEGQFRYPRNIAIDSSGNVYVTDHRNCRVQKFDSVGKFLTQWGSYGSGEGQFYKPVGVAIDSSGNVYVTDEDSNRIQKFNSVGTFLAQWGSGGNGDGQFFSPAGIDIDSSGNFYVVDKNNYRIQKFATVKITPTITWNNPADIIAGTALSSTQFNAAASVPGTLTYTPPSGTVLNAGTQILKVDFAPTDTATYNTTSKEVTINVLKATPTITWNNPADITYGTALSSTELNAASSVPGTFTYTQLSGIVLSAGTQTLHVDFTPTDTATYNTTSMNVTINVLKATPKITWSNPADIIAGTALSNTQLNAVASVPGTLTYTPPSETMLNAGTQTLKVDFTPNDIANYNTATQTVTINVLTHVQGIQQIATEVQSLNLVPEQANLLIVKLDTATKNLNNGNTLGATTELNAFTNQVNAFINNGKISSSEGQALIDDTNNLIKAMNNIFNFPAASVPEFPSVVVPVAAILGLVMIFGRKKE